MYDSLVNELQFEIDRHNLRVTVNQARKSSMQEVKEDLGKVSLVRGLRDDPEFLGTTGPTTGDEF